MTEPSELVVDQDFDAVYRREYPGLFAVATVLSGDDAEDLVQEALVRALVRWDKVARLERPGGWCHRVLVNLCRNRWRRRLTEDRFLARLRREEPSTDGPTADVVDFWRAVRTLPEQPRSVVALYYAGDHTVAEVASILGIPEGTVRSDLSRARVRLRERLEA